MSVDLDHIRIGSDPASAPIVSPRTCARCGGATFRVFCGDCVRLLLAEDAAAEQLDQARRDLLAIDANLASIPAKWQWASFDAAELPQRVRRHEAIAEAREALARPNVVLVGGSGAGKTSLACAMLRAILQDARASEDPARRAFGAGAMFAEAYFLAKTRAEHALGDGEAPAVKRAKGASVLLLRNLGLERAWNTAIEEVLYERQAEERPTIVTTGFGRTALGQKYGDGIARRIFEKGFTKIVWCAPKPQPVEARR